MALRHDVGLKPPGPLVLEGDVVTSWKLWIKKFEMYMTAAEYDNKDDEVKVALLLYCLGEYGLELFETFNLTKEERDDYEKVKEAFEEHFVPAINVTFERHKFNSRVQRETEPFENFLFDLRKMAELCDFGILKDQLIKDRIVVGVNSDKLREKLLSHKQLTLHIAIDICKAYELTQHRLKEMENTAEVDKINIVKDCGYCGNNHPKGRCPAYGKFCTVCNAKNHFAIKCRRGAPSTSTSYERTRNMNRQGQGRGTGYRRQGWRVKAVDEKVRVKVGSSLWEA